MDNLVRLLELAYASGCAHATDIMRFGFEREVQEERSWFSYLYGWCIHVADQVAYLDGIIQELEFCYNHMSEVQILMEFENGDGIVLLDSIMYFHTIREFQTQKLTNLRIFLEVSAMRLEECMLFVSRFNGM
ncbi:hypothetical protein CTI12_AA189590 [Artemisia annua]|uniref:Uncharacterized protein n=1 Tax=Artemisia annua TaxID=35608 RepID=A0A2U1P5Z9_ARTAN|nr:hypothetical protein CTI12_AA189590 [Artemisia annua]